MSSPPVIHFWVSRSGLDDRFERVSINLLLALGALIWSSLSTNGIEMSAPVRIHPNGQCGVRAFAALTHDS